MDGMIMNEKVWTALRLAVLLGALGGLLLAAGCGRRSITEPPPTPESYHGVIRVVTTTTGVSIPYLEYKVALGSLWPRRIQANDTLLFAGERPGPNRLLLTGLRPNCGVLGADPLLFGLGKNDTVEVHFDVFCGPVTIRKTLSNDIVFSSDRGGSVDLYVMDADGANPMRITSGYANEGAASPSPDRAQIAFLGVAAGSWGSSYAIYVMNADGSALHDVAYVFGGTHPRWSPDGKKIAFGDWRVGEQGIYTVNSDGTDLVRLSGAGAFPSDPEWSLDGTSMVFCADGIYRMKLDGTGRVRLLDMPQVASPVFSPDGSRSPSRRSAKTSGRSSS